MCNSIIVSLIENIFNNENYASNYSKTKKKTDELLNEMIRKESLIDSLNNNQSENNENVSVNDESTVSSANISDKKSSHNIFKDISPSSQNLRRLKSKEKTMNQIERKDSVKSIIVESSNIDSSAKHREEFIIKDEFEENSDYYTNTQDNENLERNLNEKFENNNNTQKKKKNKHKKFKYRKGTTNSIYITQNNLKVMKRTLSVKPKLQNNIKNNDVKNENIYNNPASQSTLDVNDTYSNNEISVKCISENKNENNNCNLSKDINDTLNQNINFFSYSNKFPYSYEIQNINSKSKFNKYNILNSHLNTNQQIGITNSFKNEDNSYQNIKMNLPNESLIPPINYLPFLPNNIFPTNIEYDQKYFMTMMNPFMNVAIENINILRKYDENLFPGNFEIRLHNDILDYSNNIIKINNLIKEIKLDCLRFIENLIKQSLGNNNIFIDIHGSFATDLSIECSDIDLTIRLIDQSSNIETLISALYKHFNKQQIFDSLVPIYTASVPILKIQVNPLSIISNPLKEKFLDFKKSEIFEEYRFDKEEINKIKIDITFTDKFSKTHCSYSAVEWAKKQILMYPEIKPLVYVIKRHLQINKLNSSFNGGLSSHSILLMIVAFIKYFKAIKMRAMMDLGSILLEFYNFFGNFFDFSSGIIDINQINPIFMVKERLDSYAIIHDPLNYLNVAKNSYRIKEVKQIFSNAFDILQKKKKEMNEINYNVENENIVYEMFFFYRKSIILSTN